MEKKWNVLWTEKSIEDLVAIKSFISQDSFARAETAEDEGFKKIIFNTEAGFFMSWPVSASVSIERLNAKGDCYQFRLPSVMEF